MERQVVEVYQHLIDYPFRRESLGIRLPASAKTCSTRLLYSKNGAVHSLPDWESRGLASGLAVREESVKASYWST